MGIWQHIHTVTTTDVSPDLEEFTEILDDVNVEMIPLCYRWDWTTFQTASHIYVIHLLGVPKGDTLPLGRCSRRPVATLLWCKSRQSKRPSSIQFVQSRNCDNLLSSLFISVVDGHMAAHSHRYHHRRFPRLGKVLWNPRWCKSRNDCTTLFLRLYNLSNCIPHLCHTYIRCFNTSNSCGWAYGSTLSPLLPQRFPQIWESSLKS
jgi:hypothetical protein